MARTLAQWLAWQERLHPAGIELGLRRVRTVLERLGLQRPPFQVVTVAGTNGKGSTVAYMEQALAAAGVAVGAYTSPHLHRYNERIRVRGREATDAELCAAFERVEAARGDTPLTYFEFGTLAALVHFAAAGVQLALLEVGLGGRLDAVNAVDPQLTVITPIDLDHQDWLGPDREAIGAEKAGILRPGVPLVLGDRRPPASVLARAAALEVPLWRLGRDFQMTRAGQGWRWQGPGGPVSVPALGLPGAHQGDNAATAAMALQLLAERHPRLLEVWPGALAETRLPGRQERLPGAPEWLLDVGHNAHAARALAATLAAEPRPTVAVVGMLADKDHAAFLAPLRPHLAGLHLASLADLPRGATAEALARAGGGGRCHGTVPAAVAAALAELPPQGRLLVAGSFHTVARALAWREGRHDRAVS